MGTEHFALALKIVSLAEGVITVFLKFILVLLKDFSTK